MITYSLSYSLYEPGFVLDGDEWKSPKGHSPSFARVMRGGQWVDAQESDDVKKQQEPGPEAGRQPSEVPSGAGESAPGNGNDGKALSEPSEERGPENALLEGYRDDSPLSDASTLPEAYINPDSLEEMEIEIEIPEGEGVDANGSPVV